MYNWFIFSFFVGTLIFFNILLLFGLYLWSLLNVEDAEDHNTIPINYTNKPMIPLSPTPSTATSDKGIGNKSLIYFIL